MFNTLNNLAISKVYDGGGDIEQKIKDQQDKDWIKFQHFIQKNPSAYPGYTEDGEKVNLLLRMNATVGGKGDDEKKENEKEDNMSESEDSNTSKR